MDTKHNIFVSIKPYLIVSHYKHLPRRVVSCTYQSQSCSSELSPHYSGSRWNIRSQGSSRLGHTGSHSEKQKWKVKSHNDKCIYVVNFNFTVLAKACWKKPLKLKRSGGLLTSKSGSTARTLMTDELRGLLMSMVALYGVLRKTGGLSVTRTIMIRTDAWANRPRLSSALRLICWREIVDVLCIFLDRFLDSGRVFRMVKWNVSTKVEYLQCIGQRLLHWGFSWCWWCQHRGQGRSTELH